jgi:hypothetical protein
MRMHSCRRFHQVRRTIRRFDNLNSVCNCAVLFANRGSAAFLAELAFDHTKRMLKLGSDACLDAFESLGQVLGQSVLSISLRLPGHGDVAANAVLGIGSFDRTLVAGIAPSFGFLACSS